MHMNIKSGNFIRYTYHKEGKILLHHLFLISTINKNDTKSELIIGAYSDLPS